jgi:hypothetical protein
VYSIKNDDHDWYVLILEESSVMEEKPESGSEYLFFALWYTWSAHELEVRVFNICSDTSRIFGRHVEV